MLARAELCGLDSLALDVLLLSAILQALIKYAPSWLDFRVLGGNAEFFFGLEGTMTITRVGTTQKYASGWEQAFGKTKKSKPAATTAVNDKPAGSKKAAAKAPAKAVKKAKVTKAAPKTPAKAAAKPTAKKAAKKK